jgi:hypothetical protein
MTGQPTKKSPMFTVRWVAHGHEDEPAENEKDVLYKLDKVVESCQRRLPTMRAKYPHSPPDGFIVIDQEGVEVRRWFGSGTPPA